MGAVAAQVAEVLGWPCAVLDHGGGGGRRGKTIRVARQVEGGLEVFDLPLPAVVSAQKGLNEPRYPTLKGIMGAKKKEIKDVKAADLGLGRPSRPRSRWSSSRPAAAPAGPHHPGRARGTPPRSSSARCAKTPKRSERTAATRHREDDMAGAFWCMVEDDRQGAPEEGHGRGAGRGPRLAGARRAAQAEAVWLTDKATPEGLKQLGEWGAKRVWLLENAAFAPYRGEVWTPAVAELAGKESPQAIFGAGDHAAARVDGAAGRAPGRGARRRLHRAHRWTAASWWRRAPSTRASSSRR